MPPAGTMVVTSHETLAPNEAQATGLGPLLDGDGIVAQRQVLVDGDVADEHDVEALT